MHAGVGRCLVTCAPSNHPSTQNTNQVEEVTAQLQLANGQLAALESSLPGEVAAAQMALAEREAVVRS